MGAGNSSMKEDGVFSKELHNINNIVNSIINDKNEFINPNYNFLDKKVCDSHYVLMENDLMKHLKLSILDLGQSMFLIPKMSESKYQIKKTEVCEHISKHYLKILYLLCLIKYVYNTEKHGDYSIAGIAFRNIKIVNNIMEISFCAIAQRDFTNAKDNTKLDFGKLEGLTFLTDFVLTPKEAQTFVKVFRSILGKKSKNIIGKEICNTKGNLRKELEILYQNRFHSKLTCSKEEQDDLNSTSSNKPSLFMQVDKENPILSANYCHEASKYIIPTNSKEGFIVLQHYNRMKNNYKSNIGKIENLLYKLTVKNGQTWQLRDLNKKDLDNIANQIKTIIQSFYIQSILDYHILLDMAKTVPNIVQ